MNLLLAILLCFQDPATTEKPKQAPKAKADQEVEITSTRQEVPLKETPVATTVVNQERIESEHVESVTDLLRGLPGFYISRTGAARGSVVSLFTRGTNSNHTLILVDGFKATNDGAKFFAYDTLTPDNLGRVEAQRGAASAAYGSDAIGGVLNFISRRGEGDAMLRMSLEGGTFTTWRERLEVWGGNEQYGYSAAISHFGQADGRYANSDFHDLSFGTRFDVKMSEKTNLKIIARYVAAETEVPTNGPPRFVPLDPNARRKDTFMIVGAEANHWVAEWLEATVRLSRLSTSQFNKDLPDSFDAGPANSRNDFARTTVELAASAHLKEWGVPTVGVEYDAEELVSFGNGGLSADVRRNNKAIFAQWSLSFWDSLFLTPGVRVEDNGTFGTDTNGRIAAAYLCRSCATKFRATWGSGITEPTLAFVFGAGGNRDLRPEQSVGWDVGIDQWLMDDKLRFSLTYFENRLRSLVVFDGTTFQPFNGGDGVTRGIELDAEYSFLTHAVVGGSFTFLRTRSTHVDPNAPFEEPVVIEHEPFLRRPTYSGRAYVGYNNPKSFGVFADLIFVGSRQDSTFEVTRPPRERAGAYVRVDLSGYVRIIENLRAVGRVENLFDSPYEEVIGFPANHANFLLGLEYALKL